MHSKQVPHLASGEDLIACVSLNGPSCSSAVLSI